jgi:FlaA1/EpsC-like NDP-sugar epimerase
MLSNKILNYRRSTKRIIVLLVDLLLLPLALWASFSLRLDVFYMPDEKVVHLFLAIPFIAIPIFVYFGLYRAIIRYMGFLAMWAVVKAVSLYTLAWGVVVLLGAIPGVPRSVLLINWLVTLLLIGGSRALARWWLTGNLRLHNDNPAKSNVAIYGAGAAGIQIAKALSGSPDFNPVVFIDDNRSLQGSYIFGLRV